MLWHFSRRVWYSPLWQDVHLFRRIMRYPGPIDNLRVCGNIVVVGFTDFLNSFNCAKFTLGRLPANRFICIKCESLNQAQPCHSRGFLCECAGILIIRCIHRYVCMYHLVLQLRFPPRYKISKHRGNSAGMVSTNIRGTKIAHEIPKDNKIPQESMYNPFPTQVLPLRLR